MPKSRKCAEIGDLPKDHVKHDQWAGYQPVRVLYRPLGNVEEKIDLREASNTRRFEEFVDQWGDNDYEDSKNYQKWWKISSSLETWVKDDSWTRCTDCQSVIPNKMGSSFWKTTTNKRSCYCKTKYVVPRKEDFDSIGEFSSEDQKLLAVFEIDVGNVSRAPHGYVKRQKPFTLYIKSRVDDKLASVDDPIRRNKLQTKFNELLQSQQYRRWYDWANDKLTKGETNIPYYEVFKMDYVEMAVWPLLYVKENYCESILSGKTDRVSAKTSFHAKCLSAVVDFSQDYELLQYQFDRWLFKTVCGAVESGKRYKCTPRQSLESKAFCSSKWQNEHLLLIDATRQFDDPDLFITLTVGEWDFPKCKWLDVRSRMTSDNIQMLPYDISVHIMNTLEQYARSYITGASDTKKWKRHLLADKKHMRSNVKKYFYRFEFQDRGTPHLHMLVWLTNMTTIEKERFSASADTDIPEVAFNVHKLYKSDRERIPLPVAEETSVESKTL